MLHNCTRWSQWRTTGCGRPGPDVKVEPTERVAPAITDVFQGLALGPLVGSRGRRLPKLSGFSIFECLWRALHYHESDELVLNHNIALVWPKQSFLGWIYIWRALRYEISFLLVKKKKKKKMHKTLINMFKHFGGGCKKMIKFCIWLALNTQFHSFLFRNQKLTQDLFERQIWLCLLVGFKGRAPCLRKCCIWYIKYAI